MATRTQPPVYFTKLVLKNIRSFAEQQELCLANDDGRPARWTLIIGDNGVGKTTLLQCLARMRPKFSDPPDDPLDDKSSVSPLPIEPELASEESNDGLEALARSGENVQAGLEAYLSVGFPLEGRRSRHGKTISTSYTITLANGRFKSGTPGGEISGRVKEPLVLAYGAGRHPKIANGDKSIAIDPIDSLFKAEAELYNAEELLYQLDYSALRKRSGAKQKLERLKKLLSVILPDIQHPGDIEVLGPRSPGTPLDQTGIRVKTPYGSVSFSQLSLGYQMVFAWTVDIAWRLIEHYPDSSNPFNEAAIVIVDEIDLHLHPSWQREIRAHLTDHFPNIQFIVTAHSPLMAQSSLGANLAVIRKLEDHAVIENDPIAIRDWRLDQIITSELFGFESARSPEVAKQQKRRLELVKKLKLSKKESTELAELNKKISELPTAESFEDQKTMDIIRRAAEQLPSPSDSTSS